MKVVIVGGGASGMALAVMLKKQNSNLDVTVLEKQQRICKKLLITGNGQCNISNASHNKCFYHGNADFAEKVIGDFSLRKQQEFFRSIGIDTVIEPDGKVYPKSYQAASVVDSLRFSAEELGVRVITESEVLGAKKVGDGFEIIADKKYFANRLIIATGGAAGGKLGSFSGYELLRSFGHKISKLSPSIVQIKTEKDLVKSLKGVKVVAQAKAISHGKALRVETGEVLFTEYGLSGPAIMQLSGTVLSNGCDISLDLEADTEKSLLIKKLTERKQNLAQRDCVEFLNGFINKRLGQAILKFNKIEASRKVSTLSAKELEKIADTLKDLSFKVTGDTGFANAQVTSGGALTSEFESTLESKLCSGLYAMGEVLDIDGDCGGFNLAFAWSSANKVAESIGAL